MRLRLLTLTAISGLALLSTAVTLRGQSAANWLQWGGPTRNFVSDSKGLASTWPAAGPKKLWSRMLGEGHSSIVAENGRLYTMYRLINRSPEGTTQEEVVAAFDAASGKTVWEFKYPASTAGIDFSQGPGPHSTPLIVGNRIYATSSRSELFALDKASGKRIWSHDMVTEYRAIPTGRGYTCSPIFHNGLVIVTMGGPDQAVAAFDAQTGKLAWKGGYFVWAPASPILIDVDGQTQLVVFGGDIITGMNPASGQVLWTHPHKTDWGLNISTPVWSAADHLLFVSSAYGTGSRALELRQKGGKTAVVEKWASRRMRVHIGTVIRIGDYAYGSSGDFGPAVISAVDMKTGTIAWQDRSFSRAQLLLADGKLVVLDEDGTLGLATVSPQGLKVLARANVLTNLAWTPPTLVGTSLYVRDRKTMAAFDLSGT
ncbi:MAG TPA: PQQ-binding-like beta-propeller repeat protein [Vicinamibacterales bacterium]|nr:PQQ-binding-like beta-propeller repeat protein [Vicinamibacterales bacterium]